MDALTSTEFRKVYAKLTVPAAVTVNGHVIGMWLPSPEQAGQLFEEFLRLAKAGSAERVPFHLDPTYNTRPFTPVPKSKG